jgi:hypothetical protein
MKARQRKMLERLRTVTNDLGGKIDRTTIRDAAHKWADKAEANLDVSKVLYAVLVDDSENPNLEYDLSLGEKALINLEQLVSRIKQDQRSTSARLSC